MKESIKIELTKTDLIEISRVLNKEVKNNPELMVILSKLSLAYYQPLTDEIGELITDKFNL